MLSATNTMVMNLLDNDGHPYHIMPGDRLIWYCRESSSIAVQRGEDILEIKRGDRTIVKWHEMQMDKEKLEELLDFLSTLSGLSAKIIRDDGQEIHCTFEKA